MFPGDLAVIEINLTARRLGTQVEEWLKCRQLVLIVADVNETMWSAGERVGVKAVLVNDGDTFGIYEVPDNALMTLEKFKDPSRLFRPFQFYDI